MNSIEIFYLNVAIRVILLILMTCLIAICFLLFVYLLLVDRRFTRFELRFEISLVYIGLESQVARSPRHRVGVG